MFCDSIRSEINERTEAVRDPAERTSAGETKMVRVQTKETEDIEIRIEEVMYRYLDMILEKNPNAIIITTRSAAESFHVIKQAPPAGGR